MTEFIIVYIRTTKWTALIHAAFTRNPNRELLIVQQYIQGSHGSTEMEIVREFKNNIPGP